MKPSVDFQLFRLSMPACPCAIRIVSGWTRCDPCPFFTLGQVVDFYTTDADELCRLIAQSMHGAYNAYFPMVNECLVVIR